MAEKVNYPVVKIIEATKDGPKVEVQYNNTVVKDAFDAIFGSAAKTAGYSRNVRIVEKQLVNRDGDQKSVEIETEKNIYRAPLATFKSLITALGSVQIISKRESGDDVDDIPVE
jgi:hypothetical protein